MIDLTLNWLTECVVKSPRQPTVIKARPTQSPSPSVERWRWTSLQRVITS